MPSVPQAGNVLLPQLTYKLSLRLPPTLEADSHGRRERLETVITSPRHRDEQWHKWVECLTSGAVAGRGD